MISYEEVLRIQNSNLQYMYDEYIECYKLYRYIQYGYTPFNGVSGGDPTDDEWAIIEHHHSKYKTMEKLLNE